MALALLGFALLFVMLALPMALLAITTSESVPATAPTPRAERAGLALVSLCFIIPILVALLRSTLA
jgi:hypothetical protein